MELSSLVGYFKVDFAFLNGFFGPFSQIVLKVRGLFLSFFMLTKPGLIGFKGSCTFVSADFFFFFCCNFYLFNSNYSGFIYTTSSNRFMNFKLSLLKSSSKTSHFCLFS